MSTTPWSQLKKTIRSGTDALAECRLQLYHSFKKPEKGSENIDFDQPEFAPFVTSSLQEFDSKEFANRRIPLSFLGHNQKTGSPNGDPFFSRGFRFVGPDVAAFWRLCDLLPLPHRNLCLVIRPDHPVHFYADLDDETDPSRDGNAVMRAFQVLISECFRRDYGREFDWSGLQWYDASSSKKFSKHCHVRSEAWMHVRMLAGWHKDSVKPYIEKRAKEGDRNALLLIKVTSLPNQAEPKIECIIDEGVYTVNRNFRLYGHCKPTKTALQAIPAPCDAGKLVPSDHELMWRSLVTYAITSARETWCKWREHPARMDDRSSGRKHHEKQQTPSSSVPAGGFEWMRRVRIPWLEQRGLEQPAVDTIGFWAENNEPYVRYVKSTAVCIPCTLRSSRTVKHENNHSYLTLDTTNQLLVYRSFRDECKSHAEVFPLPETSSTKERILSAELRSLGQHLRDRLQLDPSRTNVLLPRQVVEPYFNASERDPVVQDTKEQPQMDEEDDEPLAEDDDGDVIMTAAGDVSVCPTFVSTSHSMLNLLSPWLSRHCIGGILKR
jgi:hypothetical protein